MGFTGHCRCGRIMLAIDAAALPPLYACHCLDCQRWSGSAFGLHLLCLGASVRVEGEPVTFMHEGAGHTSTQYACGVCHTRLFNETTAAPGMRVVRAGVLEGAERFEPVAHIWTRRKQPWVVLPQGVAQWAQTPTAEEFGQVLMG